MTEFFYFWVPFLGELILFILNSLKFTYGAPQSGSCWK